MRQAKGNRLGNARLRFYSNLSSLTFLCWLSSAHAFSSLVCVTTPAELQTALTNAETATLPTVSLSPSSTLVNSGDNSPLGGVGALDAAGNTRVVFDTVDVSAYELQDDIFKNGFD
jgi:hypothetical protein